jgi:hypothetical protein
MPPKTEEELFRRPRGRYHTTRKNFQATITPGQLGSKRVFSVDNPIKFELNYSLFILLAFCTVSLLIFT